MKVYLNQNFLLTYSASFISLFGSKLLMISYVAFVFSETRSATLSAAVFATDWVANLFVGLLGAQYIDRMNAKTLLIAFNAVAALVTLLFLPFSGARYFAAALGIIFVRALLNSGVTNTRVKALVQFFDAEETDLYSPVFNSSMPIAIALAGATGTIILKFVGFAVVVWIDAITFAISALLITFARPNAERLRESMSNAGEKWQASRIKEAFQIIGRDANLMLAVFYIILSVTSFQATYEVLATTMPQAWYGMGKSGTAVFFLLESIAVTGGMFCYQFLVRRAIVNEANQRRFTWASAAGATALYLSLPLFRGSVVLAAIAFFLIVLVAEFLWAHGFKRIVANSPQDKIVAVVGVQTAMGYTLMGVFAFIFSAGVDHLGITGSIVLNVVGVVVLVACWEMLMKARYTTAPETRAISTENVGR